MARLLDAHAFIDHVELLDSKADFPYREVAFESKVPGRENYKQPAERYRVHLKNPLPDKCMFLAGDLIKASYLTDLVYQSPKQTPFEHGFQFHSFSSPNNLGSNMLFEISKDGDVKIPTVLSTSERSWKKVSDLIVNKEQHYFDFTVPYTKYFELDNHYAEYSIEAIAAMTNIGIKYHDENFDSTKCFAIYTHTLGARNAYDLLENDLLETNGKHKWLVYANSRVATQSQEDFIKQTFNVFEYSPYVENRPYGYYFNFGYSTLTFGGEEIKTRRGEICSIGFGGKNCFKNDGKDFGAGIVVIHPNNPEYLYDYVTDEALLTTFPPHLVVIKKNFNRLHESQYKPGPLNIKKEIKIISTKIFRKDDTNASGNNAGWGYNNGAFMRLTFSINITKFKSYMERTLKPIVFYFPKLLTLGDVTQWVYTLPSLSHINQHLGVGTKIFSFADPGGGSSTCEDLQITTTGVHKDYCVSIHRDIGENWVVYNAIDWSVKDNNYTITCEFPLSNFITWNGVYKNELYNCSINCLDELPQQTAYIMGLFGDVFFDYGITPPYVKKEGVKDNSTAFLEYFHEGYMSIPPIISDSMLPLISIGLQNEITIHQKYARFYQNEGVRGGGVWANVCGESWMLRNIQLPTISRVRKNNVFSLPSICYFEFPNFALPPKPDDKPEGFCDWEDLNECLFMPRDEITKIMYSCIYLNNEHTKKLGLEYFIKHIPLQTLEDYEALSVLSLLPGFGSGWLRE